jgi:hypothetical protein
VAFGKYSWILFGLVVLMNCQHKVSMSKEDVAQFINNPENGLVKTSTQSEAVVQLIYQPCQFLFSEELKTGDPSFSCDSMLYLVMKLSRRGQEIETSFASDPHKFARVVEYLSNDISRDVVVEGNSLKVYPMDVHYTRTFGASTQTTVLLVFSLPAKTIGSDIRLKFSDSELGTGLNEFEFQLDDINRIPSIL